MELCSVVKTCCSELGESLQNLGRLARSLVQGAILLKTFCLLRRFALAFEAARGVVLAIGAVMTRSLL